MAYRNGTYVAFHAQGTNIPGNSDIDYYNLMKAWTAKSNSAFTMVDSHAKTSAVRDSSKKATLQASIQERLRNSKNMVLIIGEATKLDDDWVPFEICQAVDAYKIPIIAAYTNATYSNVRVFLHPPNLSSFWPASLARRISNNTAHVIHIPFKEYPIAGAINQFNHNNFPVGYGLGYYGEDTYQRWGLL